MITRAPPLASHPCKEKKLIHWLIENNNADQWRTVGGGGTSLCPPPPPYIVMQLDSGYSLFYFSWKTWRNAICRCVNLMRCFLLCNETSII